LRRITLLLRIILLAAAATAPARILDAAVIVARIAVETVVVTAEGIAAVVAVGGAVADALVAVAHKAAQAAGAICLLQNMLLLKAANPAVTTIAAASRAVTTIAVPNLRAHRRRPLPLLPRTKSFSPVNPSQNIAASLP
jgi:hypothetical protein